MEAALAPRTFLDVALFNLAQVHQGKDLREQALDIVQGSPNQPPLSDLILLMSHDLYELVEMTTKLPAPNLPDTAWRDPYEQFISRCTEIFNRYNDYIVPLNGYIRRLYERAASDEPLAGELAYLAPAVHELPKPFRHLSAWAESALSGEEDPGQFFVSLFGKRFREEVGDFPKVGYSDYPHHKFLDRLGSPWRSSRLLSILSGTASDTTQQLREREIKLPEAVRRIAARLDPVGTVITISLPPASSELLIPQILADPVLKEFVENAYEELHSNAFKQKGVEPRIEISCQITKEGIKLTVKDNAGGLAPRIINNWGRGGKSTKTTETHGRSGGGNGLYLNQRIIAALGGRLVVQTRTDDGVVRIEPATDSGYKITRVNSENLRSDLDGTSFEILLPRHHL